MVEGDRLVVFGKSWMCHILCSCLQMSQPPEPILKEMKSSMYLVDEFVSKWFRDKGLFMYLWWSTLCIGLIDFSQDVPLDWCY